MLMLLQRISRRRQRAARRRRHESGIVVLTVAMFGHARVAILAYDSAYAAPSCRLHSVAWRHTHAVVAARSPVTELKRDAECH